MIHLAIAFDNNYLMPFYALVASIFENNTQNHFHCIIRNIDSKEKQEIIDYIAKNQSEINFYEVDETLISQFVTRSHWNTSVYYKMFFPLLVQNIDKLLYLDTDMLVVGSLKALYETGLGNYPLAAVYDNYVKTQPDIGIDKEEAYFNSGMLLIDIKKWNAQKISENAIDFLQKNPEKIKFVDQCALNAVLKDNWQRVSEKYNLIYSYIPENLPKSQFKEFLSDKSVLHFTLQRPWTLLCKNRFRYLYRDFLQKSPKKNQKVIFDFQLKDILKFFKIRLIEFYTDNLFLQKIWRKIKL